MSADLKIIVDNSPASDCPAENGKKHTHWVHSGWVRRSARTVQKSLPTTRRAKAGRCPVGDRGAVTAEYAIVIMAAVAFAGLLVAIMRSSEIRAALVGLVEQALNAAG